MVVAGTIAVVLVVLTAGVLLSRLRVEVAYDGAVRSRARWLALGVDYDGAPHELVFRLGPTRVFRRTLTRGGEDPKPEGRDTRERKGTRSGSGAAGWWREWRPFGRAVGDLVRRVSWERLEVDAEFGTDDPALTGMLYGFVCAVGEPLASAPNVHLRVEPDFVDERFEGRAAAAFSVRVAHLGLFAIRMARIGRRKPRGRARKEHHDGRD